MTKSIARVLLVLLLIGCQETENPQLPEIAENGIKIGNQVWMKRNLDLKTFENGDEILHASNQADWNKAYLEKIPAWSYYDNVEENGQIYGLIYNYYAIIDARGLAPKGWKIPTISDWNELFKYNGGVLLAGIKLKSADRWIKGNGTNESGFNALAGGERYLAGYFNSIGLVASFWTSSLEKSGDIVTVGISDISENSKIFISTSNTGYFSPSQELPGFYLRCIAD